MRALIRSTLLIGVGLAATAATISSASETVPVYQTTLVGRTIQAVNFKNPDSGTYVDFRGTPLQSQARGQAQIDHKEGTIRVDARVDGLEPATRFGDEYLTYVVWAITPEGRATNMGELTLDGNHGRLEATTELQAFGLIVTAEPYFAVTQPSNVVVLEATARPGAKGRIDSVEAHYQLLERGSYKLDPTTTLQSGNAVAAKDRDLAQAERALQIARQSGAPKYASTIFAKGEALLHEAQQASRGSKSAVMLARQAAQTAEDARQVAVKQREAERIAAERAAAAKREATARAETAEAEQKEAVARADAAAEASARQAAEQRAAEANSNAARAEAEKTALRAQLLQQLSVILETTETTRGLLVNVPDVSFDVNRSTLKPDAREKLAKLAGVIVSHPGLKLDAEGHTDSTGSDEWNQTLSEQRAGSVRDYLVAQGLSPDIIVARGFGKTQPVATNDTAAGRQRNRRVEIIVSGELLGQTVSVLTLPADR